MRDPETMLGHCVGCKKTFDAEGNAAPTAAAPLAPAPAAAPAAAANGPLRRPGMNGPLPAGAGAAAAPASEPRAGAGRRRGSRSGSDSDGDAAEGERLLQQLRAARERRERAAAAGDAASDPCQLLADRLLEGWAMLAEHCPLCNTPLMRSRAREVRCIACDLPVQIGGDASSSSAAAPADTQPPGAAAHADGAPAPGAAQPADGPAAAPGAAAPRGSGAAAPPRADAGALRLSDPRAPGGHAERQTRVVAELRGTLLDKLEECHALMQRTSAAQGDALQQHAALAAQLLAALRAAGDAV
ncbi:hypothetical protein HT031_004645 [Scenedesmus sp. PABB004]|nr:hypothetical protein HT031_004645 [Scenedesmus sp. PABB004]